MVACSVDNEPRVIKQDNVILVGKPQTSIMEANKEFTSGEQASSLIRIESLLEEMIFQQIRTRVGSLDDAKQLFSIALQSVDDSTQEKIESRHSTKGSNTGS